MNNLQLDWRAAAAQDWSGGKEPRGDSNVLPMTFGPLNHRAHKCSTYLTSYWLDNRRVAKSTLIPYDVAKQLDFPRAIFL
jgi:hypothetical protein